MSKSSSAAGELGGIADVASDLSTRVTTHLGGTAEATSQQHWLGSLGAMTDTSWVAWLILFLSGALEALWLIALKRSHGFEHPLYGAASIVLVCLSFALFALALRTIPSGTAYVVAVAMGAAGGLLADTLLFGETQRPAQVACLALILVGVVGLYLFDHDTDDAKTPAPSFSSSLSTRASSRDSTSGHSSLTTLK